MEQGSWKNYLSVAGLILSWIVIGFLLTFLFTGKSGLSAVNSLRQRMNILNNENLRLEQENKLLLKQINYRRSSAYLEELSRTELRQVKEHEIIILLPTLTPDNLSENKAVSGGSEN